MFADLARECAAALDGCALFDRSAAGKVILTGPDAPRLVHNISTNDVGDLPLGAGCETYFCDARARALFVAWVYHLKLGADNALWLDTTPGRAADLLRHLDRFLISEAVELRDATAEFAQLHVAGPRARAVLEIALGDDLPDLPEFAHLERTFGATATASIRARTLLGVPGYDIVCLPARVEGVRRMLAAAGAVAASPEAFEVLRIEAGTPVFGPDIDATRFVMEVADPRAVSFTKGCFPGQEPIVMARDRAGRVNRRFVRLRADGDGPLTVGAKLSAGGQDVAVVTSAAVSPRSGSVAVGYARWDHAHAGAELQGEGRRVVVRSAEFRVQSAE